jgi:N-acetylneuraminic acid mutarotase
VKNLKSDEEETNMVHTYDERSRKWKQTIPHMPTARYSPGVLSLQSALVVAGGNIPSYSDAVDIFKADTSRWYRTDPLPTACQDISLVGDTCYALGGYNGSRLNQALYATIDDLFRNAVPIKQTTHSGSSDTQSAWKTLPNTPIYRPAAAMLAGSLLAIGGREKSTAGAAMKEVYMYSPSTNSWNYISDLPAPRSSTAGAVLSSTEILVIGGYDDVGRVNTVYKGTLTIL